MPVKVIDASALAAFLFAEPEADRVLAQIEGHVLAAPKLLPFEMASVCLKKLRRYPKKRNTLLAAHALLDQMAIEQVDVPLGEAILLAEQKTVTIYDAVYVWLAQVLAADLVTLDRKVLKAFRKSVRKS